MIPNDSHRYRSASKWELQAGDLRGAADHLGKARRLQPQDAATALLLGQALEKIHDLAGARDALEASPKLLPGQFDAHLLLGQVYMKLKEPNAAEDQFAAALLIQPRNSQAVVWMARAKAASRRK